MNSTSKIRLAILQDIPALLDIYNTEVKHSNATFDLQEKTIDEWTEWFMHHNDKTHPIFIAEVEGHVAGYASLSKYREKEAYKTTVEMSIYIDKQYRGRGVANALMKHIIQYAKSTEGIHCIISVITAGNAVSTHLHEKHGFTYAGTLYEVGIKFGEYCGIDNYELILGKTK